MPSPLDGWRALPSPRDGWRALRSLRGGWAMAVRTARLMVGVPDYDAYVAHRQAAHPGEPVMTLAAFHRDRIERRYGGGPDRVPRCC